MLSISSRPNLPMSAGRCDHDLSRDLRRPKSGPWLLVLRSRRAEDIEHACSLRAGAHGVGHISRRAPEIALLHWNFLAALDPDARAFEQHPPLLLGMMMQRSLAVRPKRYHRQHGLLA